MANTNEIGKKQAQEISEALNEAAKGKPLLSVVEGVTVYLASTCVSMDEDCKNDLFAAIVASFTKNYLNLREFYKKVNKK